MTYVPVNDEDRLSPAGRRPLEIPDALVKWLQHCAATGGTCEIDVLPDDDPEEIADLRRALVRAGYRLFGDKTIYKSFTDTLITFKVGPKKPRTPPRKSGGKK